MAGMLPGVECARRRRLHQSGGCSDSPASNRRSSFCLYAISHVHDHSLSSSSSSSSSSSLLQRSLLYQACPDEKLGGAAREAKERLDERLGAQRNSQTKREGRKEKEERREAELQIEVYGRKRSGFRRLMGWSRLKWKASESEEEECAVCLESFEGGDTLIHLPCAHRFHSTCLDPWLQHSAHCPCCRMPIISH